jgi:signal transduction histidine kinase
VRLVAGAALWIAAALAAGGYLLATLFGDYVDRSFDDRLSSLLDALIAVTDIDENGQVVQSRSLGDPRFEQPFSGWYWQVADRTGVVLTSRSLWDQNLDLSTRENADDDVTGPDGERLRVLEREIALPGADARHMFAIAADTATRDSEVAPFLITLSWSLGILGAVLVIAVLIQVQFGLQPLRRIHSALADMRFGRTSRLEGIYPSEIRPLVDELNALLAHNDAIVERARTHVGNLAHALKTPLALLRNEAARETGKLADLTRRQVEVMRRWVDHYLARARAVGAGPSGGSSDVRKALDDLCRTLGRIHAERAIDCHIESGAGLAFRGDSQDLEEMLGNLLDNAWKWTRSAIWVDARQDGRDLAITIEDDGPGLSEYERTEALARGKRLDETVIGSGLGLAIVRDIAELYGGTLDLGTSSHGGLRVGLRLPAAGDA